MFAQGENMGRTLSWTSAVGLGFVLLACGGGAKHNLRSRSSSSIGGANYWRAWAPPVNARSGALLFKVRPGNISYDPGVGINYLDMRFRARGRFSGYKNYTWIPTHTKMPVDGSGRFKPQTVIVPVPSTRIRTGALELKVVSRKYKPKYYTFKMPRNAPSSIVVKPGQITPVGEFIYDLHIKIVPSSSSRSGYAFDRRWRLRFRNGPAVIARLKREAMAYIDAHPNRLRGWRQPLAALDVPTRPTRVSGGGVAVPGTGYGDLVVGRTTPADVFRRYGRDAHITRRGGAVVKIDYSKHADGRDRARSARSATRPKRFRFRSGTLSELTIGWFQTGITIEGGLRLGSSLADVKRVLGSNYTVMNGKGWTAYRYDQRGVRVLVDDGKAIAYYIHARRGRKPDNSGGAVPAATGKLELIPGQGYAGISLGQSTPDDVLRHHGRDAYVRRRNGVIYELDYSRNSAGKSRPLAERRRPLRPKRFEFKNGVLSEITVGHNQTGFLIRDQLSVSSTLPDVQRVLGTNYKTRNGSTWTLYIYTHLGVKVLVDNKSRQVIAFYIIPISGN